MTGDGHESQSCLQESFVIWTFPSHFEQRVSRVFVVVVSSVVCLGLLQKRQTTAGTVVGNKYTRYSGLVSMLFP